MRNKLYEYGLYKTEVEDILSDLITEGFLNEERFAKAFAGGKFRMKHWGRIKIVRELEAKGLTKNCIALGLKEIDQQDYLYTLRQLLEKKSNQVAETNVFVKRDKLATYVIQKGFEPDVVWPMVKEVVRD